MKQNICRVGKKLARLVATKSLLISSTVLRILTRLYWAFKTFCNFEMILKFFRCHVSIQHLNVILVVLKFVEVIMSGGICSDDVDANPTELCPRK